MISDKDLLDLIDRETKEYHGQIDHLYEAVGMVVVGRLMGWRVMRFVSSNRCWKIATNLFGDPRLLMDEKGKYYKKSIALSVVDKLGTYWDIVKRNVSMPVTERRLVEKEEETIK